jgi:hypothetical protein
VRAREIKVVTEHVHQERARLDDGRAHRPVDGESDWAFHEPELLPLRRERRGGALEGGGMGDRYARLLFASEPVKVAAALTLHGKKE